MSHALTSSYAVCMAEARRAASNFYYSFYLLPRRKRRAMCALYAFLRRTDDLGDGPEPAAERRENLARWRRSLAAALDGDCHHPILPALADTVHSYRIPAEYLFAVIDGVEMDFDAGRYATWDELAQYCHCVASAVGLACIHIWGFRDPRAVAPARSCGLAFQLTNILRDLKEDAARGRIYLPQEDLARFGYTDAELLAGVCNDRFRELMRFEIERAERLYEQAAPLAGYLEPDGRRVFTAMLTTYRRLLGEISRRDGDVFTTRVRLSTWQRLGIAVRCMLARPGAREATVEGAIQGVAPIAVESLAPVRHGPKTL